MGDVLYLAWRYLAHNRVKTAVLVASTMLIGYLPAGLRVLVAQSCWWVPGAAPWSWS
jgi:hypothetical protein